MLSLRACVLTRQEMFTPLRRVRFECFCLRRTLSCDSRVMRPCNRGLMNIRVVSNGRYHRALIISLSVSSSCCAKTVPLAHSTRLDRIWQPRPPLPYITNNSHYYLADLGTGACTWYLVLLLLNFMCHTVPGWYLVPMRLYSNQSYDIFNI